MKTLTLQPFTPVSGVAHELTLLEACVNYVEQSKGITASDQLKRLRILRAVEENAKRGHGKALNEITDESIDVSLEDADVVLLQQLTADMKWSVVSKSIADFGEKVRCL